MQRSERDELKRAINRFQELANPQALLALLDRVDEQEKTLNTATEELHKTRHNGAERRTEQ